MLDAKWIGWAVSVFLGLTLISGILGGTMLTATDIAYLNQMGLTQKVDFGFFTLPIPNTNYISGLYHMLIFDYPMFGGMGQLIMFGLYSITFMIGFGLFITLIGIAVNKIRAS